MSFRTFSALSAVLLAAAMPARAASAEPVQLNWLGAPPPTKTGVSWGVPWPQGAVPKGQAFAIKDADGKTLPLQTWPLAYWPDGSLKFTGFATVAGPEQKGPFTISGAAAATTDGAKVTLTQAGGKIDIDTGAAKVRLSTTGANLIDSISVGGKDIAREGQLVVIAQNGPDNDVGPAPARERFVSTIKAVTVEQTGPVRAVVKVDGLHQGKGREWLPFSVRLYFYAGEPEIRMVHTLIFDGDQQKDFIRGLGLTFAVPFREKSWNRHVRFSGVEGGLWSEPIQPGGGNAVQQAGERVEPAAGGRGQGGGGGFGGPPNQLPRTFLPDDKEQQPVWSDYKLAQLSPEGFTVHKRTNAQSSWVFAGAGKRASGLGFVGDVTGGLGISMKDFWQTYPTGLEVRNAGTDAAQLTAWLWSPEAPAMDMRHYATRAHGLNATYEDVQEGMSQAYGVARTSEFTIFPTSEVGPKTSTVAMAQSGEQRPLLVVAPKYMHATGVFGVWSVPDRSTPLKAAVEDKLDSMLEFYQQQVKERYWYGFWVFGDYIHSYSSAAKNWYYDWGGHAWQNTELATPLWVWMSYLRTGRADIFRMAEAQTRNTSETNVYHIGPMAGLGSRHNVVKWGDGAKEMRVSQAVQWRPYYYLTTDERTGDIMRAQLTADLAAVKFDPMRLAQPLLPQDPKHPGRIRIGPDWFAMVGNWMTEWERTGDNKWRDRINGGVDAILAMPYWIKSGVMNGMNPDRPDGSMGPLKGGGSMTVGYDPATGKLFPIPDPIAGKQVPVNYNLSTIQGGAQVMFELVPLLGRADWAKAWLQYCRLGSAPAEVLDKDRETGNEGADGRYVENAQGGPRLAAWAYAQTKNKAFADRAIANLAATRPATQRVINPPEALQVIHEAPGVSTNNAAQSGLTLIEILALCADALPNELPAVPAEGRGGRGARGGPPPAAGAEGAPAPAPKQN